jgi:predicted aspartyl protease
MPNARALSVCLLGLLTVIGLGLCAATQHSVPATELDRLVQDKRYPQLEQQLQIAHLDSTDRIYFEGILADRNNRIADAVASLEKILPQLRKTSARRSAIALRTLAADYFKVGRYGKASETYSALLVQFASEFNSAERQDITDNRNMFELLRGAPPQIVSGARTFSVPIRSNALGNTELPVQIGGKTEWWILDTGANESTIALSTARRLGLELSKTKMSYQSGATGEEVPSWMAVIPKLGLGDAVVSNVIVAVSEDSVLNVNLGEDGHYQIQGILGYPVLVGLGSLKLSGKSLEISPESPQSSRSTRLYVEELTPLVEATVDGHQLLFGLDTGSNAGSFTRKYLQEFPERFSSLTAQKWGTGGLGGTRWMHAYVLPQVDLHFGDATATLRDIPVLTEDLGEDPLDAVFGNLGQSLLTQFRSYTIDFTRMEFTAGKNTN